MTDEQARLQEAKAEALRFRSDLQEACHLIAKMHAAAVGEVTGPARGVVEDVEDLRRSRDELLNALTTIVESSTPVLDTESNYVPRIEINNARNIIGITKEQSHRS